MKEMQVTRENFKHVQAIGKQNVRIMILLFFLLLLIYSPLRYFMMRELYQGQFPHIEQQLLIRISIELVVYFLIVLQLWRFSKLGKWLFTIYALVCFYSCKDIPVLFHLPLTSFQGQMIRILFVLLVVGKNILAVVCMLRLYTDKQIRCIWSLYDLYEKDLIEVDGNEDTTARDEISTKRAAREQLSKLEKKAKTYLRVYTGVLLLYVYGSMCMLYLFMFIMRLNYPKALDGMEYVQRILLLATLFTAFIWSLPALGMFLYKSWTRIAVWVMAFLEVIRFVGNFPYIYKVFQTQHYMLSTILTLLILECIRYFILYKIIRNFYSNLYIKAYWDKKWRKQIQQCKMPKSEDR